MHTAIAAPLKDGVLWSGEHKNEFLINLSPRRGCILRDSLPESPDLRAFPADIRFSPWKTGKVKRRRGNKLTWSQCTGSLRHKYDATQQDALQHVPLRPKIHNLYAKLFIDMCTRPPVIWTIRHMINIKCAWKSFDLWRGSWCKLIQIVILSVIDY